MITTLAALRYRVNLSQSELSRLSDIPQPVISNYERGLQIPLRHAETLLEILRDADISGLWIPENIESGDLGLLWSSVCREREI